MSATNSTLNYELPQFIATDKPAWLVDFNGAMSTIDTAIKEAKTAGDNAQTTANTNAANITTLDGTVTSQGTAIGVLTSDVAGNTGSINTINSLIGNGQPTTTDKTIIGAINEINAKVGDVEADDVSFDNANTGLVATDVQAAIVEVKGLIPAGPGSVDADDVSYVNTSSGLTATDVQAAIDETVGKFGGLDIRYDSTGQKPQYSTDGGTTWVNFNGAFSVDEVESAEQNWNGAGLQTNKTLTYTFLEDHEEVLVMTSAIGGIWATGGTPTNEVISATLTNSGTSPVTEFHNTVMTPVSYQTSEVMGCKHTYHVENVKAGDTFTFTFAQSTTLTVQYSDLTGEYTIFTIN